MKIKVVRYSSQSKTSIGVLLLDNVFECHTLEDSFKPEKVYGETRIPAGKYDVELREFGGHYERYSKKYTGHGGMLWIKNVPNFEHILIHIGNKHEDSHGCILVGTTATNNKKYLGKLAESTNAYLEMYFKVLKAFERGEKVTIEIIDLDKPTNI